MFYDIQVIYNILLILNQDIISSVLNYLYLIKLYLIYNTIILSGRLRYMISLTITQVIIVSYSPLAEVFAISLAILLSES